MLLRNPLRLDISSVDKHPNKGDGTESATLSSPGLLKGNPGADL